MEFNQTTTAAAFLAIIVIGVGGLVAAPMMATETVLMMVAPSMIAFGLIMLAIGVKHGEYRTAGR